MKALVIGATGATGKELVNLLLESSDYSEVSIFVRRPTGKSHSKLTEHVVDFSDVNSFRELITGDVLFSCIGTTLKDAGSKEKQWKIDYDIPADFATTAKQNNVNSLVLVSSYGASAKSNVYYSMMKGKLEDYLQELHFPQYIIFRPGPLIRENTDRLGEKISVKVIKFFNAIGLFKNLKPITTAFLAQKLVKAPKSLPSGNTTLELDRIISL
ncbi:Semialdehyde dehydrogenase, NAD binding domain [Flavobacterium sp. ACN2]|uniref:NAD(P)H-binding protein n=1 Tax=unclassified Flavobacterium TaxID=196869 RepID=UPI000BB3E20C|nr:MULTISPECIES: NAD(P)H-binding protein [unclassified Flavobacterium]MDY0989706.1 NAD(P)H-binding protein [Flavobacterium sp. CFBP9031]PBI94298.1 Semialdehyde dehydrogenase, NAD binding domain [Flavobacterium sp. ACN2]